jgi:structural maintenance of chromosome 2
MYIIEIILEGFKSYNAKTVIKPFDKNFNAITGLNGTGKSNILDSILFLLGLNKDWDTVRVSKIQELVYKQGHGGTNRAEVTILFDNSNKEDSPPEYLNVNQIRVSRQIIIDKSKYFINGQSQ